MCGIYKITNLKNDKIYIGQSRNIQQRWRSHRSRPFQQNSKQYNSPLYRAIRKYGLQSFSFEVIEECEEKNLDEREKYWINQFDSCNTGYNLTEGGDSASFSILTKSQVREIQQLLISSDFSQAEIGEKFGVNQRTISYINTGVCWLTEGLNYPLRKHSISPIKNGVREKKEQHKFCSLCNKEISLSAEYCVACSHKQQRKVDRPDREQLKKEIRTSSFSSIGRKYGVSDNTIRKWCKTEQLPFKVSEIKKYSDKEWEKI